MIAMQKRCAYLCHFQLVGAFTNRLRPDTLHAAGAGATSAQPVPGPTPVANGSIFQSAQPINYGYQPLFEDRRPRNIGDTLTIVLQENVSASKAPLRMPAVTVKLILALILCRAICRGCLVTLVPMSKPPVVTRSTERAGPMPAIPLAAR